MPREFRKLTPAEFTKIANARITDRRDQQDFMDALNARQCQIMMQIATNGGEVGPVSQYMLRPPELQPQPEDQMINGLVAFASVIKGDKICQ